MSTLKADAVTSAQDNTALTLSGTGTGGVKVNDFFVQTKGADIASGTTLTLGKDGNQFDVTGTTTITGIATQGIGSYVTLHFDGILTFTHHSTNLILPGAANITTAAGDIAVMYEYASADWRCVSYTKASGEAVVAAAGAGAWELVARTAITGDVGSVEFNTGYTEHAVQMFVLECIDSTDDTTNRVLELQFSDDAGSSFKTSGYLSSMFQHYSSGSTNHATATSWIQLSDGSNASDETEGLHGIVYCSNMNNASQKAYAWHQCVWTADASNPLRTATGGGIYNTAAAIDGVRFQFSGGNIQGNVDAFITQYRQVLS